MFQQLRNQIRKFPQIDHQCHQKNHPLISIELW